MEKLFLIKSNGKIHGPMSVEVISKGIRSKQFYALDEIQTPFGRWHYLRDNKNFSDLLKNTHQSRREDSPSDATMSTGTQTATVPIDVVGFGSSKKLIDGLQKQVDQVVVQKIPQSSNMHNADMPTIIINETQTQNKKMVYLIISICIAIAGWVLINKIKSPVQQSKSNELAIEKEKIIILYQIGSLAVADKKADSFLQKNQDLDVLLQRAQAYTQSQREVEAQRIYEDILSQNISGTREKEVLNLLAVALMVSHDFTSAEQKIQRSLQLDARYIPAIMNQSFIYFFKNEYEKVEKQVLDLLSQKVIDSTLIMLLAENSLSLFNSSKNSNYLKASVSALSAYTKEQWQDRQKVLFFTSILQLYQNKTEDATRSIQEAIFEDPGISEQFITDNHYYRARWDWSMIAKSYAEAYSNANSTPTLEMGLAFLKMKAENPAEANRISEAVLLKTPNDKNISLLAAWVYKNTGKEKDSATLLHAISSLEDNKLFWYLQSLQCLESGDGSCEENFLKPGKEKFANQISYEMIMADLSSRHNFKIPFDLQKLISFQPRFIPAIKLQLENSSFP